MSTLFERIDNRTNRKKVFLQLKAGYCSLRKSKIKITMAVLLVLVLAVHWFALILVTPQSNSDMSMHILRLAGLFLFLPAITFVSFILMFIILGKPFNEKKMSDSLYQIGLVNHADQMPALVTKYRDANNKRVMVHEFMTNGIDLPTWRSKRLAIEKVLNCHVVRIDEKLNSKDQVLMYTVPANNALPENLNWSNDILSKKSFELVMGENLMGREIVNLARVPHLIFAGASGSGKTILFKSVIMQCVQKGAQVYIADFKGGVDFPYRWREKCNIITLESDLLETLEHITGELDRRKGLFNAKKSSVNIDEYNAQGRDLQRIVLGCDEIAEILDKTGLSKERKALVEKIESHLSLIARQGRSFGIHLIISTQRPDSTILTGQIKANIQYRVCGRADKILSSIIIDSTDAADQIPSDAQGRFITSDGVVFQGYMINENEIIL